MDWKLQNNHEKRRKKQTKQFYRNLLVGNLEKLAKNRQVCLICHINVNRNQEVGTGIFRSVVRALSAHAYL